VAVRPIGELSNIASERIIFAVPKRPAASLALGQDFGLAGRIEAEPRFDDRARPAIEPRMYDARAATQSILLIE